jgi:excisionase family DNA binding protein
MKIQDPRKTTGEAPLVLFSQLLYSIPHAAKELDISPRLLWQFVARGEIKATKIHGRRLIHRRELEKFAATDHAAVTR